jgi:hypothetical protein
MIDPFELFLKHTDRGDVGNVSLGLISVADTADGCRRWFESREIPATAADIVAMTRLVMERTALLDAAARPDEDRR